MGKTTAKGSPLDYVLPDPPPFTLKDIKNAVPAHCFEHSYVKSFGYLFADLLIAFTLLRLTYFIDPRWPLVVRALLWGSYIWAQGCVCTGLWVIGHECGHGGFSSSRTVNNVVGLIVHSALLVPFFSWKYTHGVHHHFCCQMERDQVFVPESKSNIDIDNPIKFAAPVRVIHVLVFYFLGWPLHLFTHVTGQKYPRWTSHFDPYAMCFQPSQRVGVILSDVGLVISGYVLYLLCKRYTFSWMLFVYFLPYLVVNGWLVIITQLQHTDTYVPHYRNKEWNYLRGALATIDRDFGWLLNHVFHHIQDTHVVHHLFSTMPFYHAQEATRAVAPLLGKYRLTDFDTSVAAAVWNCYRDCAWVPDKGDIIFYESPHFENKANEQYQHANDNGGQYVNGESKKRS